MTVEQLIPDLQSRLNILHQTISPPLKIFAQKQNTDDKNYTYRRNSEERRTDATNAKSVAFGYYL
ncbi:hypothetical protein KSD_02100 [Ktedonobacter sp. SOSP1-85]|uniref:hypothetical protein n=1 Tax=Ktedonobacter sp. SOSP1-85 TaxID=2778367 RepID=UPI00191564D4|nr:hypothetical protein [Ktedonobacter sp. SOSP1-85]GHO72439.1 hypothetical protein KSD_02100 [Ktedonobacter sp. SOSP1-85]